MKQMIENPETLTEQMQNFAGYIVQIIKAVEAKLQDTATEITNTIDALTLEEIGPMDPDPVTYFKQFYEEN